MANKELPPKFPTVQTPFLTGSPLTASGCNSCDTPHAPNSPLVSKSTSTCSSGGCACGKPYCDCGKNTQIVSKAPNPTTCNECFRDLPKSTRMRLIGAVGSCLHEFPQGVSGFVVQDAEGARLETADVQEKAGNAYYIGFDSAGKLAATRFSSPLFADDAIEDVEGPATGKLAMFVEENGCRRLKAVDLEQDCADGERTLVFIDAQGRVTSACVADDGAGALSDDFVAAFCNALAEETSQDCPCLAGTITKLVGFNDDCRGFSITPEDGYALVGCDGFWEKRKLGLQLEVLSAPQTVINALNRSGSTTLTFSAPNLSDGSRPAAVGLSLWGNIISNAPTASGGTINISVNGCLVSAPTALEDSQGVDIPGVSSDAGFIIAPVPDSGVVEVQVTASGFVTQWNINGCVSSLYFDPCAIS